MTPEHLRLIGHAVDVLRGIPADSVHCVVTSPPYYLLREYGCVVDWPDVAWKPLPGASPYITPAASCELGREARVEDYVGHLVLVARELRRVLRPDGTLWLDLGDKYVDKCLLGVPDRVKLALVADGWCHRADVIWHKPNPTPNSPDDRPVTDHERVLLLSPSRKYYYDRYAATQEHSGPDGTVRRDARTVWTIATKKKPGHGSTFPAELARRCVAAGTPLSACGRCGAPRKRVVDVGYANPGNRRTNGPRSTGRRATSPGFAARRRRVVEHRGWRATCSCGANDAPGVVLDPFAGTGTVADAAALVGVSSVCVDATSVTEETTNGLVEPDRSRPADDEAD